MIIGILVMFFVLFGFWTLFFNRSCGISLKECLTGWTAFITVALSAIITVAIIKGFAVPLAAMKYLFG